MAEKSDALPSLAPVVVKSGPPDVGGDIWRRKCQKLKRKCEEFEQVSDHAWAWETSITKRYIIITYM